MGNRAVTFRVTGREHAVKHVTPTAVSASLAFAERGGNVPLNRCDGLDHLRDRPFPRPDRRRVFPEKKLLDPVESLEHGIGAAVDRLVQRLPKESSPALTSALSCSLTAFSAAAGRLSRTALASRRTARRSLVASCARLIRSRSSSQLAG